MQGESNPSFQDIAAAAGDSMAERRNRLVSEAMRLIQADLSAELSVERLAEELGVSWSTLAHVFPGVAGETCWQYVKRLRLERAAYNLLSSPGHSVLDAAVASGYTSQAAFTRAFSKAFGCSPARFRKRADAHPIIESVNGSHHSQRETTGRPFSPIPWKADELAVRIEQRPTVRLAYIRGRGEYKMSFIAGVLLKMLAAAWRHGLMKPEATFYGVMYEDPYLASSGEVAYDACVSLPPGSEPVGPFGCLELPAGAWACVDCDGPTDDHFASWNTFGFQWLLEAPWTPSHPLVAQQYHLPGDLLRHPGKMLELLLGRYSATELIPVKPGPSGSLLPV